MGGKNSPLSLQDIKDTMLTSYSCIFPKLSPGRKGGTLPMGGVGNFKGPTSIYIPVVGIRMGSIEVNNRKLNIAMPVDLKEVHTGGTSLSKAKGLRLASCKCQCTFSRQMHLQKRQ